MTVDKSLSKEKRWLTNLPGVRKLILGQTQSCRHHYPPGHLRIKDSTGHGIAITGYGDSCVINMYIRLESEEDKQKVVNAILNRYAR